MTTSNTPIYASQARPWLKFYDQKYIDQTMPACTAFELVSPAERRTGWARPHWNAMAASSPTLILSSTSKRQLPPCGPQA